MTAPTGTGTQPKPAVDSGARGASLVAAGIFLSKIVGLVRNKVFSHFFGQSPEAGAFIWALRFPNFLQNLLGEGVLAGSFVPVYAKLLAEKKEDEADRLAGGIFGLLTLVVSLLVALGMWATPLIVDLMAPGFEGDVLALTIRVVRILFPATGVLVLSAWCLGVLNSHRRFFLSYAAPVVWNGAVIATLLWFGKGTSLDRLAVLLAYGTVLGGVLQFVVQLPKVMTLLGHFRPNVDTTNSAVRQTLRSFGPVVFARGVVQISAFVDSAIATLVSPRAVVALSNAQTLYLLPVSLFGMSVSVAELTEMSRTQGDGEALHARIRERIQSGVARMAFFVVPSAAALLLLGDVVASAFLQSGKFTAADSRLVWILLMGSTVGLLASTQGRLYSSSFYAMKDTRSPLAFAAIRVTMSALLAYVLAIRVPALLGHSGDLTAVGLTLAGGLAAWVEFLLLRRKLERRVGRARLATRRLVLLWVASLSAAAVGWAVKWGLSKLRGSVTQPLPLSFLPPPPAMSPVLLAALVVGAYGATYFALTYAFRIPQAQLVVGKFLGRGRR